MMLTAVHVLSMYTSTILNTSPRFAAIDLSGSWAGVIDLDDA